MIGVASLWKVYMIGTNGLSTQDPELGMQVPLTVSECVRVRKPAVQ